MEGLIGRAKARFMAAWQSRITSSKLGTANGQRQGTRKRRTSIALVAVALLVMFALSAGVLRSFNRASQSPGLAGPGATIGAPPEATPAYGQINRVEADAPAASVEASGGAAAIGAPMAEYKAGQAAQGWDRKIIRSGTLQLQVKDVAASLDQVRALAGTHGGYISQTDSRQDGEYTIATVTLQVPAAEFDSTVAALRRVGLKTVQENVTSSDVTEEYTDLQSQLRNLQATEGRMLALMTKAERIEDILTLDRELRQIQAQLEQAQGRINFLGKRSEMSTITVSLYPEMLAQPVPTPLQQGWNPVQIAEEAWSASLELLSGVATVVITVAVFSWWLLPLILIAWLFLRPRRGGGAATTPSSASEA